MVELKEGLLGLEIAGGKIKLRVEGRKGAGIQLYDGKIVEGNPVSGEFMLNLEDFMNVYFTLYGIEENVKINLGSKRVEAGKAKDFFLKFTDFSRGERTIFYLSSDVLFKVLNFMEGIIVSLREVCFFHEGVAVRYVKDKKELHLATREESEVLYGFSLELFKMIIKSAFKEPLGFMSFGAGRFSLVKPTGKIILGGMWKDRSLSRNFLLSDIPVPKLTAKLYLVVR